MENNYENGLNVLLEQLSKIQEQAKDLSSMCEREFKRLQRIPDDLKPDEASKGILDEMVSMTSYITSIANFSNGLTREMCNYMFTNRP